MNFNDACFSLRKKLVLNMNNKMYFLQENKIEFFNKSLQGAVHCDL